MYNNKLYSLNNTKLIYEACPNAKYIMGKGEFKAKHDHIVLDDEKPIEIIAPVFDEDTNKIEGFERVYVYDVSQTRPILGEDKMPTPKAKELIDFIEGKDVISELKNRISELNKSIEELKVFILGKSVGRETASALRELGKMFKEKIELTGEISEDRYILESDGEGWHFVEGFVGDDAGKKDVNGIDLKFGDTVTVISSIFEEKCIVGSFEVRRLKDNEIVKIKDCSELQHLSGFVSVGYTINEYEESVNKLLAEADLEEVNQQNFDELEM